MEHLRVSLFLNIGLVWYIDVLKKIDDCLSTPCCIVACRKDAYCT